FAAERLGPGRFVGLVFGVPALAAGTVAGGEGDRLVVEEERGPAVGHPELAVAAAEAERAGDPEVAGMETDDLATLMEHAAIAGPGTAQRGGDDLAGRGDSVPLRHAARSSGGQLSRRARRRSSRRTPG